MYAAGFGTMTFRGRLPFFWDSRQVEAFGLGVVILTGYLLNYVSFTVKHRMLPFALALLMWVILLIAVGGSIRRSIWVSTFFGMFGVMLLSRRTTVIHYFVVLFVGAITIAGLLLAPGLDNFRDHMGKYVQSLNLFDDQQLSGNDENAVHVYNVEQYYKMVTEKTDILALGLHGPSGTRSRRWPERGIHGGIQSTWLGAQRCPSFCPFLWNHRRVLYIGFFAVAIARTWRIYWHANEDHVLKHIGIACGVYLFMVFAPSLLFVPPFYTSSKGLFYIFLAAFIVGSVAHHLLPRGRSMYGASRHEAWPKAQARLQPGACSPRVHLSCPFKSWLSMHAS